MKQDSDNGNGLGGNTEENTGLSESRKRSLANLKPAWPKGISGNPSGRPRKPITDAYADIAEQKYPDDPKGRTYAQLAAEGQFETSSDSSASSPKCQGYRSLQPLNQTLPQETLPSRCQATLA